MTLSYVLGVAIGVLLVVSGAGKAVDVGSFRTALTATYRLPTLWATSAALLVPAAEILVGTLLMIPSTSDVASVAAIALLIGITWVVLRAWSQGATGDCGCFGSLRPTQLSGYTVLRAAGLLGLALTAWAAGLDLGNFAAAGRLPNLVTLSLAGFGVAMALVVLGVGGRIWIEWRRGDWGEGD